MNFSKITTMVMTLEELFNLWIQKQDEKVLCSVAFLKINTIRRSIEAKYHIDWLSKIKAEALFIVDHEDKRLQYNEAKEKLIQAEAEEEKASRAYYLAKSWQEDWRNADRQVTDLLKHC